MEPVDLAFLAAQTFDDAGLQKDVLTLFVTQARRVLPTLPVLSDNNQADAAHLLKGSARGIGAWAAAAAADRYENAGAGRAALFGDLVAAFQQAEAAILRHLAADPFR